MKFFKEAGWLRMANEYTKAGIEINRKHYDYRLGVIWPYYKFTGLYHKRSTSMITEVRFFIFCFGRKSKDYILDRP